MLPWCCHVLKIIALYCGTFVKWRSVKIVGRSKYSHDEVSQSMSFPLLATARQILIKCLGHTNHLDEDTKSRGHLIFQRLSLLAVLIERYKFGVFLVQGQTMAKHRGNPDRWRVVLTYSRWLNRKVGASFGFGGKLVHFSVKDGKSLKISRVVENPELLEESERFENAMKGKMYKVNLNNAKRAAWNKVRSSVKSEVMLPSIYMISRFVRSS